jgi:predicted enzyme related to lactoylglutathione lyase
VEDVKAVATQAEQAGARLLVPPAPAIREGRVALILDPTGAAIGLAHVTQQEVQK